MVCQYLTQDTLVTSTRDFLLTKKKLKYEFNIAIYRQTYLEYSIVVFKLSTNCEPPTIAASQAPLIIYLYAQSNAYAELEHAVSTVNDGPHKPSAYERRFER